MFDFHKTLLICCIFCLAKKLAIVYDENCQLSNDFASLQEIRSDIVRKLNSRKLIDDSIQNEQQAEYFQDEDLLTITKTTSEPHKIKFSYLDELNIDVAYINSDDPNDYDSDSFANDIKCVRFIENDSDRYSDDSLLGQEQYEKPSSIAHSVSYLLGSFLPKNKTQYSPEVFGGYINRSNNSSAAHNGKINDAYFPKQWNLTNSSKYGLHVEKLISRNLASQANKPSSDPVIIAVIDSGCDFSHSDLLTSFWVNKGETNCHDGIDNDGNGLIDDCRGWNYADSNNNIKPDARSAHGTAISGIIGAMTNNVIGVASICPMCKLMCIKFMDRAHGSLISQVEAINYAIKMGARISNNSYGGYVKSGSKLERESIMRAKQKNHLFVASAGNKNLNTDLAQNLHTPSGYLLDNMITVGASTKTGGKTHFSNFGKNSVDVFAPGSDILSTNCLTNNYTTFSGTSFASPQIAGLAGLLLSTFPTITAVQMASIIKNSCIETDELLRLSKCGGVVNAEKAYAIAEMLHKERLNKQNENGYLSNQQLNSYRKELKFTKSNTDSSTDQRMSSLNETKKSLKELFSSFTSTQEKEGVGYTIRNIYS